MLEVARSLYLNSNLVSALNFAVINEMLMWEYTGQITKTTKGLASSLCKLEGLNYEHYELFIDIKEISHLSRGVFHSGRGA